MQTVNIILCGLGGQGILFMSKLMGLASLEKGLPVLGSETHGMAQRGGSVISHLRIGPADSSLIRPGTGHFLFSLDEIEAYRNLPFLSRGAAMYVNSDAGSFPRPEVRALLEKQEIFHRSLPAGKMALELGSAMSSNLALLGYASAFDQTPLTYDELRGTLEKISPERIKELNLRIFDSGFESGKAVS